MTGPTTPTTPGRLLVVQHVPWEEPGLIATLADESGLAVDTMLAGSGREPSLDGCAGLVLMGGPMGALDDDRHPWLAGERRLVRDAVAAELPTLGICLGHQLIAVALGGTLQPGATEEIGVSGVQLTRDSALGSADERPDVLHWHRDNVTAPPGAQVLASTPGCPVQAFRCGSALGLQFHLEVDPALLTRWLAVPEMVRDLPGDCPPDALLDALRAAAASQQRLARSVFGAFLDRVAGTSRQAGPA